MESNLGVKIIKFNSLVLQWIQLKCSVGDIVKFDTSLCLKMLQHSNSVLEFAIHHIDRQEIGGPNSSTMVRAISRELLQQQCEMELLSIRVTQTYQLTTGCKILQMF